MDQRFDLITFGIFPFREHFNYNDPVRESLVGSDAHKNDE